ARRGRRNRPSSCRNPARAATRVEPPRRRRVVCRGGSGTGRDNRPRKHVRYDPPRSPGSRMGPFGPAVSRARRPGGGGGAGVAAGRRPAVGFPRSRAGTPAPRMLRWGSKTVVRRERGFLVERIEGSVLAGGRVVAPAVTAWVKYTTANGRPAWCGHFDLPGGT